VDNYTEWSGSSDDHGLTRPPPIDYEGYLVGICRFEDEGNEPTDILHHLKDRLSSFQGGLAFRAFYHVCDHDDARDDIDCSTDYATEWGDVPNDVPPIPDDATVV
jgi:hypothetical protein